MVRGASRSKDRPPAPSAARRRPRLQCGGQGREIQCRRSVGLTPAAGPNRAPSGLGAIPAVAAAGVATLGGEAVRTIHRPLRAGLERHSRLFAAARAGGGEHLALLPIVAPTAGAITVATTIAAAAVATAGTVAAATPTL